MHSDIRRTLTRLYGVILGIVYLGIISRINLLDIELAALVTRHTACLPQSQHVVTVIPPVIATAYLYIRRIRTAQVQRTRKPGVCSRLVGHIHSGTGIRLGTGDTHYLRQTCTVVIYLVRIVRLLLEHPQTLCITRSIAVGDCHVPVTQVIRIDAHVAAALAVLYCIELGRIVNVADIDNLVHNSCDSIVAAPGNSIYITGRNTLVRFKRVTVPVRSTVHYNTQVTARKTQHAYRILVTLRDCLHNIILITGILCGPAVDYYTGICLVWILQVKVVAVYLEHPRIVTVSAFRYCQRSRGIIRICTSGTHILVSAYAVHIILGTVLDYAELLIYIRIALRRSSKSLAIASANLRLRLVVQQVSALTYHIVNLVIIQLAQVTNPTFGLGRIDIFQFVNNRRAEHIYTVLGQSQSQFLVNIDILGRRPALQGSLIAPAFLQIHCTRNANRNVQSLAQGNLELFRCRCIITITQCQHSLLSIPCTPAVDSFVLLVPGITAHPVSIWQHILISLLPANQVCQVTPQDTSLTAAVGNRVHQTVVIVQLNHTRTAGKSTTQFPKHGSIIHILAHRTELGQDKSVSHQCIYRTYRTVLYKILINQTVAIRNPVLTVNCIVASRTIVILLTPYGIRIVEPER